VDPSLSTTLQDAPVESFGQGPATEAMGDGGRGGISRGVLLLLLFLACVNLGSIFSLIRSADGAQDFSIFYTGAKIVRSGHASQLYDLDMQARYQTARYRNQPLPFDHPAYELLLFLPLVLLPFSVAYGLWWVASIAMAFVVARLLAPRLEHLPRPGWVWILAMVLACFPVIWALAQGQDSVLLLLLFSLAYVNLKSRKDALAGVLLAAGLFKFTLVLPFVVPFLFWRRWKFLAGFSGGAAAAAGISVAMTGIAGARQYVRLLLLLLAHPEAGYINPVLMPNARGFLSAVLGESGLSRPALEILVVVSAALMILAPVLTFRSTDKQLEGRSERFDLWFGLNLTVALLASPHLYWHDLTPMLLPIVLAVNALLKPLARRISWQAIAWGLAYACAWPVYLTLYPSYFFVVFCALAVWFVRKLAPRLRRKGPAFRERFRRMETLATTGRGSGQSRARVRDRRRSASVIPRGR
jgi:hypothetical protein